MLTIDHIPPRNLFASPRPSNLITVWNCQSCNGSASEDDVYFRNVISMRKELAPSSEAQKILETTLASFKRSEQKAFTRSFFESYTRVPTFTQSGLFAGHRGAIRVDLERVDRVLTRIVRGLFFLEFGTVLPRKYRVVTVSDHIPSDHNMEILICQTPRVIGADAFSYRYVRCHDDENTSIWLLMFYGILPFVLITLPNRRVTTRGRHSG